MRGAFRSLGAAAAAATCLLLAHQPLEVQAHAYDPSLTDYNLNTNTDSSAGILDFNVTWTGNYTPSPINWRELPFYTVLLDKFFDGDPTNNDYYETNWEWDLSANQLRHGGDIMGFINDRVLDYIYGMGYRVIYLAGTPFVNMPWQADGYSALDFTLLDPHYGTLDEWRTAIAKIHAKGMYVCLDLTTTTMGDLIGVIKYLNTSAPFDINGYEAEYKWPPYAPWNLTTYKDFQISNTYNNSCTFPNFYQDDGSQVDIGHSSGCYASDFDQFGDVEAFGVHPDWQRQLSKFASVQDRLREWDATVAAKLEKVACLIVEGLDPDAVRIDKATQQTVDFVGTWGDAVRTCAKNVGKNNFFIPGEITGGNTFGSLYIGRGRQPASYANLTFEAALNVTANESQYFMRPLGKNALDAAAFHYSIYRSLTRFLSMDGNLDVAYDVKVNFIDAWNVIFSSNDFINWNTGQVDPRHLFGTTNQDVFRWPSLQNGTQKMLLGQLITNLVMPGIPLAFYGEEQSLYLYDSTANNYLFGRQAMSATRAWQIHGCYRLGSQQYYQMPLDRALDGCMDDWNSLDHFDPTATVKQVMSHFTYLRSQYPALQDGFELVQLGNWTTTAQLPGSNQTETEWGLWSTTRSAAQSQMNQTVTGTRANLTVWTLYSNLNVTHTFQYDCNSSLWISSPYPAPVTVRNLLYPYENVTLETSMSPFFLNGKAPYRACLPSITMDPLGFKVFVPQDDWVAPLPKLVGFTPGHDARIWSDGSPADIQLSLQYTDTMTCSTVSNAFNLTYVLDVGSTSTPSIDSSSVTCSSYTATGANLTAVPLATWQWQGTIRNAPDGIYHITLANVTNAAGIGTGSSDHLLFRKGTGDNPMVFQNTTYSSGLLNEGSGTYTVTNKAVGADMMRYSVDFGISWTNWTTYQASFIIPSDMFTFPGSTNWTGQHVRVQYWSSIGGSSAHSVDSDANWNGGVRRYPSFDVRGPFNEWGFDDGEAATLSIDSDGNYSMDIMVSWPNYFQAVPFAISSPFYFGDVDGDLALDLLPPNTQAANYMNLTKPGSPWLGWRLMINQEDMTWGATPIGSQVISLIIFFISGFVPPITGFLACWIFLRAYYGIKVNKYGFKEKKGFSLIPFLDSVKKVAHSDKEKVSEMGALATGIGAAMGVHKQGARWPDDMTVRRKVLIATLEYEIMDWKLKVKIGGLGVMSSLMGKAMHDVDLLWVVPKVKDIEYPQADPEPPIIVTIFGEPYHIDLQSHKVDNVTYCLLDSPVFRAGEKANPYPARMDDLSSAIFYSTWNQCIAEVCRRTPDLDVYHINDYHGTLAPFYLLPTILPVCLSLHNAEFQGLWPLRTKEEMDEVCRAFNLSRDVCEKYIQFGNVFNLLHAAASFISIHQKSVGVAGVSDKYGKRSWARYPALWTLKTIDSLPNPDPTDIEALDETPRNMKEVEIDEEAEAKRPELKRQCQEWSGLKQDPDAELFVFVGRWSLQKGVDLIADVFTGILEKRPKVQLVAVGPVVDLYGRFAAVKLNRLMELYPGRVYSKPEFTALPPYVFSGADFALIPSRDEPFGLVAVEFGRKGALGVGSRLGGLGLMPGWWFPVESDSTTHMHSQFAKTIKAALKSTQRERAILRARSALQRFPVLEWRNRLEDIHRRSIKASRKYAGQLAWGTPSIANVPAPLDLGHAYDPPPDGVPASNPMDALSYPHHVDTPRIAFSGEGEDSQPLYDADSPYGSPHLTSRRGQPYSRQSSASDITGMYSGDRDSLHPRGLGVAYSRQSSMSDIPSLYGDDEEHERRRFQEGNHFESPVDSAFGGVRGQDGYESPHFRRPGSPSPSEMSFGRAPPVHDDDEQYGSFLTKANAQLGRSLTRKLTKKYGRNAVRDPFVAQGQVENVPLDPLAEEEELLPPNLPFGNRNKRDSFDSINSVLKEHDESPLNKAVDDFTDENGEVTQNFIKQLTDLTTSNSQTDLCIADYLTKAEKEFFQHVKDEKIAQAKAQFDTNSIRSSLLPPRREPSDLGTAYSSTGSNQSPSHSVLNVGSDDDDNRSMSNVPLTKTATLNRLQVRLQANVFGWPLYALLLALGQVLCATSFQLSLLGGSSSQSNFDLYIISGVNIPASVFWYLLNHLKPANYALSMPWYFFGIAFMIIGVPAFSDVLSGYTIQHAITLAAGCAYSWASAAGFLFFSSNFGEEAGGGTDVWVIRACFVQGVQNVWTAALWYWGFKLSGRSNTSQMPIWINAITMPLGIFAFTIGYSLFVGLPPYYAQLPGQVPNFVKTLFRRKLVLWYLVAQVLQSYWLSAIYGRNWSFLWNTNNIPTWATVILVFFWFIIVWTLVLAVLSKLSKEHTWILPLTAIGLIAPRWAQMLWGVSNLGLYVPWASVTGPYLSSCLWLWLGVLDALQSAGLGMILLQTLSRVHVSATLCLANIVGSTTVIAARATAPDRIGAGRVFPNFGLSLAGLGYWEFWVCLACQVAIVVGFLLLFRREQLSKP